MDFEQIRDNLMNAATQLLSLRVIVTSPSEKERVLWVKS